MELLGLVLAVPLTLITSAIYIALIFMVFRRWPTVKRIVVCASFFIFGLTVLEGGLLIALGAKNAYGHFHHIYTTIHFINFFLAPPAVGNLALYLSQIKKWKYWIQIPLAILCCWVMCMAVLLVNIGVDETIVGPDAENSLYMSE